MSPTKAGFPPAMEHTISFWLESHKLSGQSQKSIPNLNSGPVLCKVRCILSLSGSQVVERLENQSPSPRPSFLRVLPSQHRTAGFMHWEIPFLSPCLDSTQEHRRICPVHFGYKQTSQNYPIPMFAYKGIQVPHRQCRYYRGRESHHSTGLVP